MRVLAFCLIAWVVVSACLLSFGLRAAAAERTKHPMLARKPLEVEEEVPPRREGHSRASTARRGLSDLLACIRRWESRGDYRAVSSTGKYRNAYQMDTTFWLRHGGDPDYAGRHEQAPTEMQDAVAIRGLRDQGLGAWPTPSRRCR